MVEVSRAHRRARADNYRSMIGPNGGRRTSMERCRDRRRRSIETRRNTAAGGGVLRPAGGGEIMGLPAAPRGGYVARRPDVGEAAARGVPVVGGMAVQGRLQQMEDAMRVETSLCTPAINRCRPVHYFGVFDGHGGPHVAIMCKKKMHEILEEEIMQAEYPVPPRSVYRAPRFGAPAPPWPGMTADESVLQEAWRRVFIRAFSKTEVLALHTCSSCDRLGFNCGCDSSMVQYSGSTAVAVVLTDDHMVVGNCGDSRAVLSREGVVIPLSFDHKPYRADEKKRVLGIGGRIFGADTPRIEGILAMSRAIGDRYLKPYVISEPEVTFTRRDPRDEFLILASDGLWDVMTTETACKVVRGCLKEQPPEAVAGGSRGGSSPENDEPGPVHASRSACAAALLIRLALARNSTDNVCVVVVDLKRVGE